MELILLLSVNLLGLIIFCFLEVCKVRNFNFFNFGILISYIIFLISLKLWYNFDVLINQFQYEVFYFVSPFFLSSGGLKYNLMLHFGLDGISLYFILLTTFLSLICIIMSNGYVNYRVNLFLTYFLFLEFLLILSFISLDIFWFFIFFEIILIPMFFLITIWGSRSRKIFAAYFFFLYTAVGSFLILIAIIILSSDFGTTNIYFLWNYDLPYFKQSIIWFFLFFGFCIKVPMFPLHLWLPEAHVEAPTSGSIMLAGVLLKLGGYAYIRFLLPLCPLMVTVYTPLVFSLSFLSIFYCSFVIIRQLDIKKIIAYSSIIHMNIGILGLFCYNYSGIEGSLFLMFGHGLISSGLFLLIGCIYERYKTRVVYYYGGLSSQMPLFSIYFFLFNLSNISFPGTVNFLGEFLTFLGIINYSFVLGFISLFFSMFVGAFYSIWLVNRVIFGELKVYRVRYYFDLHNFEFFSLFVLFFFIVYFGFNSSLFFNFINLPVENILLNVN